MDFNEFMKYEGRNYRTLAEAQEGWATYQIVAKQLDPGEMMVADDAIIGRGSGAVENRGGAYGRITADGGEVHHTPANEISPLTEYSGPSFRMTVDDHRKTASWGSSDEAKAYRTRQQQLIDEGKFTKAVDMDVQDVQRLFGDKYDQGIQEMYSYLAELRSNPKHAHLFANE